MPTITKQVPTVRTTMPPAANGSVLSRCVPLKDVEDAPLKVLIIGPNRSGKTTLACQADKPLLLVSFEPSVDGGAESVKDVPGITYVRVVPENSPRLKVRDKTGEPVITRSESIALVREIQASPGRFKSVVVDGATSCQDVILTNILDLPELPDQLGWGMVSGDQYRQRSEETRETLRPWLDLPLSTVILAREKDHNPPKDEKVNERTGKTSPDMRPRFLRGLQSESMIAADLGGATAGWLHDSCSCVCRLYVGEELKTRTIKLKQGTSTESFNTGKFIRYLRLAQHPNYWVGIRSRSPETVPEYLENPTWAKLAAVIRGKPIIA